MDYLVMRLYTPISSWGTLAVGEDRPTVNYPTRSAVLGLLGAALGIRRSETQKLKDLADSIGIASKTYSEGTILRDYHTIQTPTTSKGVNFFTRKQELQSAKVETILSSRDYREDGLWVVAIWLKPDAQGSKLEHNVDLQQLQYALKHPKFTLYLGRKSCPLSLPLSPQIITANHLKAALDVSINELLADSSKDKSVKNVNELSDRSNRVAQLQTNELIDTMVSDRYLPTTIEYTAINEQNTRLRQVTYHWEGEIDSMFEGAPPVNIFTYNHWDDPTDRKQWQFTQRIGHQWTAYESIDNKEAKEIMSNTPDKEAVL
ncbi:type I-E CRISPR-associated protein Cas5/CasD [Psychrobacter celer]|uniref:type I-E CRISPR-associated protein Cas5/CasD n=1 Tax=Psychrobacter celer TaxID=306572 RepID=UPI002FE42EBD